MCVWGQFSCSVVLTLVTPWTAACQASLSITKSQSLLKLMSIESVIPSNDLILCCPLLLLPPTSPSIRVFFNESALHMRWPKYWSFSFHISPSNEYSGLISFRMDWLDPTPQFKSINSLTLSFLYSPALTSIHEHWKNRNFDYMDLYWQSNENYQVGQKVHNRKIWTKFKPTQYILFLVFPTKILCDLNK